MAIIFLTPTSEVFMPKHDPVKFKNEGRRLTTAEISVNTAQAPLFMSVFAFFVKPEWLRLLMESPLKLALFPFAAALEIVKAMISGIELGRARNKNLGKVSKFVLNTANAIIITTAVAGAIFATSMFGLATPIMFVAAMGATALYNLTLTIYNAVKTSQFKSGSIEHAKHKANIFRFGAAAGIGAFITVGIALLMIAAVPFAPVVAGVSMGALAVAGVIGVISLVKHLRATKAQPINALPSSQIEEEALLNSENLAELENQASYYTIKNRTARMTKMSPEDYRDFLMKETQKKIDQLGDKADEKSSDKVVVLRGLYTLLSKDLPEDAQKSLKENASNYFSGEVDRLGIKNISDLKTKGIFKAAFNRYAFQSFFRQRSDVEDIFIAAEEYFAPSSTYVPTAPTAIV